MPTMHLHGGDHGHLGHVAPTTGAGRWSLALFGGFVLGLAAFAALVAEGQRGGDTYAENWWLAAPFTAAVLAAIGAAWIGWWAIIARAERSVLVYLSTAVASCVTAFVILEITFPH